MSEPTIPVRLLIEQVALSIATAEKMANASAALCRNNKIDWLAADDEMWARQSEIDTVHSTISLALIAAGLTEAATELSALRTAAKERIASTRLELRTNCLLNGPAAPRSQTYGPDNPARLRKPGESVEKYRAAMGWTNSHAGA